MVESGPKKSVFETDMTDRDKTELNQQMLQPPQAQTKVLLRFFLFKKSWKINSSIILSWKRPGSRIFPSI